MFKINHFSYDESFTTPLEAKFNNKTTKVSVCFNNDDHGASEQDDNIIDTHPSVSEGFSLQSEVILLLSILLMIPMNTLI